MIGLYLHIPFCAKKCHYCDFVITTAESSGKKNDFLEALGKEMAHYSPLVKEKKFSTIYLGGGTPSRLSGDEITRVFSMLRRHFRFESDLEVTLEANPGDLDKEKIRTYKALGINRISLGAQSFREETLRKINRAHGAKDIYESFGRLREEGFKNINMDLILSLPGDALEDAEYSLKELKKLDPEHVSIYELTIEEKTVFGERFKKGDLKLPVEEEQLRVLSFAREFLKQNGWRHYELLNYSKPGFESKHNRLYWANEETLGLGPGAFAYVDGRRFRHSSSVEQYFQKAGNNDWSAIEEEILTPEKKEVESFLLSLRLLEGTELDAFPAVRREFGSELLKLLEQGLLLEEDRKLRLSPRGQLFAESVFAELASP